MEHLSAYEKVKLARDPKRPYFLDYVELLFTDFMEIHGDRAFADDAVLNRMSMVLAEYSYRTHEFGDSVLIERQPRVRPH